MKRRHFIGGAAALGATRFASAQPSPAAAPAGRPKVLRYAFQIAETGFDPAQISDVYSRYVTAHIFESPLSYDHLARPYKLKLVTAAEMPQLSADFTECFVKIRPGIYFQDDPAFKGKPRELVAADYVYSWKRFFDPKVKAPYVASMLLEGFVGLNEYRAELLKTKQPFDYDKEIEGLRTLDRYTIAVKLAKPKPRFVHFFTTPDVSGALAREVIEAYGTAIMEHPVGTGPFRLAEWRRSSFIALERNPTWREVYYDAQPNADDAEGQALARKFRGRRLPMVDRVEISIIEEAQPRYLAFVNKQQDMLERLPLEFVNIAIPGNKLAPGLARKGVRMERQLTSDVTMTLFNMEDPVVGGMAPEKIALRRAINLATDIDKEIRLLRRGQAIASQSPIVPNTYGYDPAFRSEMGEFDRARARALLDAYGYVDRNGDGWRENPDGSPLTLTMSTQPDQTSRQMTELWQYNMNAVGLRIEFKIAKWPEHLKQARAGKLAMWGVATLADSPDGGGIFARGYTPDIGGQNLSRFRMPEFDEMYDRASKMPDGPERLELFRRMTKIMVAYAPYKFHVHRIITDLSHGWVSGYRRPPFWSEWWHYVDVDADAKAAALA